MTRAVVAACCIAISTGPASTLPAQPVENREEASVARDGKEESLGKRWRFSMTRGLKGGPVSQGAIEDSMRSAQLDQPISSEEWTRGASFGAPLFAFFGITPSQVNYPTSTTYSAAAPAIVLGYRLRRHWDLELVVDRNRVDLGETRGHHSNPTAYFSTRHSIRTYAAIVAFRPYAESLRVGAGLSWNDAKVTSWNSGSRYESQGTRPGVILEAALALPAQSRIFVELTGQYRYVRSLKFGPYPVAGTRDAFITTFPTTEAHLSRWVWSLGLGLRL